MQVHNAVELLLGDAGDDLFDFVSFHGLLLSFCPVQRFFSWFSSTLEITGLSGFRADSAWCCLRDSNPHGPGYEPGALTN